MNTPAPAAVRSGSQSDEHPPFAYPQQLPSEGQRQYKHLGFAMALLFPPSEFHSSMRQIRGTALPAATEPGGGGAAQSIPYQKISDITGSFDAQLQKLIALSEKAIDDSTTLPS